MKQFLSKTAYFSLPIVLAAVFMELLLRNTPNDYAFKRQYLDDNADVIETLILGSSHALYDFNPEFFTGNTFNASHVSQSLDYDYKIFQKYRDRFGHLKNIVLPISYFTLFSKLEAGPVPWRIKNYVKYYGLNNTGTWADHSEVMNIRNVSFKRLYTHYVLGNSVINCSTLGWGTNCKPKSADDLLISGKKAAIRHTRKNIHSVKNQEIFKENIGTLISLMEWCNKNDVKVWLVTPPAHVGYRQHLNQEQLRTTVNTVQEICAEYDNCSYFNLLNDSNFVAEDYCDGDHLSDIGAKKLSVMLDDIISVSNFP